MVARYAHVTHARPFPARVGVPVFPAGLGGFAGPATLATHPTVPMLVAVDVGRLARP